MNIQTYFELFYSRLGWYIFQNFASCSPLTPKSSGLMQNKQVWLMCYCRKDNLKCVNVYYLAHIEKSIKRHLIIYDLRGSVWKNACCQIKKKVGHNNKIMFDLSKRILDIWNCFYDRQFIFFCCYNLCHSLNYKTYISKIIRLMNKNALSLVCYYIILFHILNFIAYIYCHSWFSINL